MRLLTSIVNCLALRVLGPPEPCGLVGLFTHDGLPPRLGATPQPQPQPPSVPVERAQALGVLTTELRRSGWPAESHEALRRAASRILFVRFLRQQGGFVEEVG